MKVPELLPIPHRSCLLLEGGTDQGQSPSRGHQGSHTLSSVHHGVAIPAARQPLERLALFSQKRVQHATGDSVVRTSHINTYHRVLRETQGTVL